MQSCPHTGVTSLVLLSALFLVTNSLGHKENPFYYSNSKVSTLVRSDGTLVKKLNKEQGNQRYSRNSFTTAIHSDWEMNLYWYQKMSRSIFGKSQEEIEMEEYFN
jgi:hypothetical protein